MAFHRSCALALAAVLAAPAVAADFPLTLHADGDTRWYDFYSGADFFAQLDRGTIGAYDLFRASAEPDPFNPTVYSSIGETGDAFPHGAVFADAGVLSWTGTGDGTFPVSGMQLDLAPFVGNDLGALGTSYETDVTNIVGTVTVAGGSVSDITLSADIRFSYDASYIVPGWHPPFDGDLLIDGDRLEIFVHDIEPFGHGALEHAWDIRATVEGVGDDSDVIFRSGFEN